MQTVVARHYLNRDLTCAPNQALAQDFRKGLTNPLDAGSFGNVLEGRNQQGLRKSRLRRHGWCLRKQCWRQQAQHTDTREGAEHCTIIARCWGRSLLESRLCERREQEFPLSWSAE